MVRFLLTKVTLPISLLGGFGNKVSLSAYPHIGHIRQIGRLSQAGAAYLYDWRRMDPLFLGKVMAPDKVPSDNGPCFPLGNTLAIGANKQIRRVYPVLRPYTFIA